jgi:hypothetical protein
VLQALRNETWSAHPDRPIDADVMAQGVAEHKITLGAGQKEANLTGISNSAFASLVEVMKKAPGIADGLNLIRRGQLTPNQLIDVIQKNGLEDEWIAAYQALSSTGLEPWEHPVSPADLALGLIRGNLTPQDVNGRPMFPTGLDSSGSNVPADPPIGIDVIKEAATSGVTPERMALLARNVGLPPGVIEGLQMLNRGIINEASFALLIEQSDARLSWGPFLLQLRRLLLTAHDYVELNLRGYISKQEMYDGTALHGMTPEDSDLLFEVLGRPLTVHQITTGLARGGVFRPLPNEIKDPYQASVHEANIKPSYYDLAIANRYNYPPLFQLNVLVKAGAIDPPTAADWATKTAEAPEVVTALTAYWQSVYPLGTSTAATPPSAVVKSQQTAALTALRTDYVSGTLDRTETANFLAFFDQTAAEAAQILSVWDEMRSVAQSAGSTPTDPIVKGQRTAAVTALRKLYLSGARSRDLAIGDLQDLGYGPLDISEVLHIWDNMLVAQTAPAPGTGGPG